MRNHLYHQTQSVLVAHSHAERRNEKIEMFMRNRVSPFIVFPKDASTRSAPGLGTSKGEAGISFHG